ncbi:MAG: hypothetical protein AB8E82_02745 [Aureispira sp.]
MSYSKRTFSAYYLWMLILIALGAVSCQETNDVLTNPVIEAFRSDTGIDAVWVSDTTLLNTVKGWQGSGDYPGVDDWAIATIPAGLDLYGGLPGQSEYYTIEQTLIDADTMKTPYWESLQVKAHPTFGYRPMVGVFDLNQVTTVAIARTLANPQYGNGGAWQIYVENYGTDLTVLDTVTLQN